MNIDFIRGVITLVSAASVVLITLLSLVLMTFNGTIQPEVGVPAIVGIGTVAGGFLWQAEVAKQAAKQAKADLFTDTPPKP